MVRDMARRRRVRKQQRASLGGGTVRDRGRELRQWIEILRCLVEDYWTAAELADHLAVGRRTVYRYLDALEHEGLPLEPYIDGRHHYYRLSPRDLIGFLGLGRKTHTASKRGRPRGSR